MAGSAEVNGRLWGVGARAWSEGVEPRMRPLFEAVLDRVGVGPGTAMLDLACGAALADAIAAERGAEVSGVDAAAPMIEIARGRVRGGRFEVADLETLPFPDASFDVVTSFNGVQFAASPVAALREAKRVLKSDGKIAVALWAPPERVETASVIGALRPLLPAPPPGTPGPFALSEPETLSTVLREGGFTPVDTFEIAFDFSFPSVDAAVRGFNGTGVAARAIEVAGQEAVDAAHAAAIAPFVQPDGSVTMGVAFTCIVAAA